MARYFFHSEDGEFVRDEEGTELRDIAAARVEAVKVAAEILHERPDELWEHQAWRLIVTDDRDLTLFTIEVSAQPSAAMSDPRVSRGTGSTARPA